MKPWRHIARPHRDVCEGNFQQAEFAADISRVATDRAAPEYQDAEKFFRRTYITGGMHDLLVSVARRLTGRGGDPVIQLQTNFGGGKTHTLLAVYHMARQDVALRRMDGISALLDDAGVRELPKARVAVIDGSNLSPNQPIKRDGLDICTLWGVLAHSLLGRDGYEMVSASDCGGTSPGKEIIIDLLQKAAPCVVLMDETVAFLRQLEDGRRLLAGTLASNMSFIQALTEAMKAVPNAMLLASLPESNTELGGSQGQLALSSLEKYFGRVQSVWKPVGKDESFEIVRRRLFDSPGDEGDVNTVCRNFIAFYRDNGDNFPQEVQESRYLERMKASYPIHPEVFDRLYEDWSTLDKFQRTRGVLRYMAMVIHRLWQNNDQEPLIMPGSLPLRDAQVRNESTLYLPQGWDAVISKEIDGADSMCAQIDKDARFGTLQAAHRVARTIFLATAPYQTAKSSRGITMKDILLGCARPDDSLAVYRDVLKRLLDQLHYLFNSNGERFWFDTHPNLRREMEERKLRIADTDVRDELGKMMNSILGKSSFFGGRHIFPSVSDIPDDKDGGIRLVLLPPNMECAYSTANPEGSENFINTVLNGQSPTSDDSTTFKNRVYKNLVVFLAPEASTLGRVKDACCSFLAWSKILDDEKNHRLNLDGIQRDEVKREMDAECTHAGKFLRDCYKYLIVPKAENGRTVEPDVKTLSCGGETNLIDAVRDSLIDDELVIESYEAAFLAQDIEMYYFSKGKQELPVRVLWDDMCKYCYFQRLRNFDVLFSSISKAVASDPPLFGYALGKENGEYRGLCFGTPPDPITPADHPILIEKSLAEEYNRGPGSGGSGGSGDGGDGGSGDGDGGDGGSGGDPPGEPKPPVTPKRRYFGNIELDDSNPEGAFHDIVTELVSHLSKHPHMKVSIHVNVQARTTDGSPINPDTIRIVEENARSLLFNQSEFWEEQ